ncbi:MAG: histidine phosphatase family protein [Candidatus Eremiobacteraeota bacterium]|nr:histidine phosphatase family protein [Candidatus Eremiobacteraeota bacterium]
MPNVFLARHGETTWNVAGRYQGRLESELSTKGLAQAQALAQAMNAYRIGRVISSPLRRCLQTAAPTAHALEQTVQEEPLLLEIAHGLWEGRYRDELAQNDPERYRQWRNEPHVVSFEGGESVVEVLRRWESFAHSFMPGSDTLLVTHDAVIRVALVERRNRSLSHFWEGRVLNGAYAWFTVEDGKWELRDECVSGHLAGIVADPSGQAL